MTDPTYTTLTANDNTTLPGSPTAVAATQSLAHAEPEKTVLLVKNTDDDTAMTFTVKAGDYPPAIAAGQGDLAVSVAFGATEMIGPLESGRFLQSDGSLSFTCSPASGTIVALKVPRNT